MSETPEPTAIEVLREALSTLRNITGMTPPAYIRGAQALDSLATELEAASAVSDRVRTILDEAVSMMPVMPAQEALTLLEEHVHSLRMAVEIAQRREPTQAEGDAYERRQPSGAPDDGGDGPPGECFVPAGGWTGRRCRVCRRWVWGGPTACVGCAELEVAQSELAAYKAEYMPPPTPEQKADRDAELERLEALTDDEVNAELEAAGFHDAREWSRSIGRVAAHHAVVLKEMRRMTAELEAARARIAELDSRRRESRQLLHRLTKYVHEDRAVTPGVTRLARLVDQVSDYLNRTHEPSDALRATESQLSARAPARDALFGTPQRDPIAFAKLLRDAVIAEDIKNNGDPDDCVDSWENSSGYHREHWIAVARHVFALVPEARAPALNRRHPDEAPVGDEKDLLFCYRGSTGDFVAVGRRTDQVEWLDGALDDLIAHEHVLWWLPVSELLTGEPVEARAPVVAPGELVEALDTTREFAKNFADAIEQHDIERVCRAAEKWAALPEAQLERFLQDNGGAVLFRLWDDTEGWSVLLWDPDTADGEPPMPDLNDTSGWSHDQSYPVALAKELKRHSVEALRERLGIPPAPIEGGERAE